MNASILSLFLATAMPLPGAEAEELTLRINLPERRLQVVEGMETIRSYRAAIGAQAYPTPTGRYRVESITWNPWWNPPSSRWARGEKKTPPGPNNPMGRVKLRFDRLLYIHGTSNEASLGEAASHGCIRLSNADALDLARLIAERTSAIPSDEIAALEGAPRRTHEAAIPGGGVPLLIEYRLVREREGGIERYEDVYDLGLQPHEEWLLEGGDRPPAPSAGSASEEERPGSADGLGLAVWGHAGPRGTPNPGGHDGPPQPRTADLPQRTAGEKALGSPSRPAAPARAHRAGAAA